MVSCSSSMPYVEAAEESLETTFQSFEVVSIASVDSLSGHPCLSDTAMMVARVMLGNGYKPTGSLPVRNGFRQEQRWQNQPGKHQRKPREVWVRYKPTQADIWKSISERKNRGQGLRLGQQAKGPPPCHISRSFISAGLRHEGQVAAICEDDSSRRSDLVRPCPPGFRLGNWRVEERPDVYATSIM